MKILNVQFLTIGDRPTRFWPKNAIGQRRNKLGSAPLGGKRSSYAPAEFSVLFRRQPNAPSTINLTLNNKSNESNSGSLGHSTGCPTDHAKIERMHRTINLQALEGQKWSDSEVLWDGLDYRREMLNHHLPVRTLNGQAPLILYPEAAHSQHPYRPEWEEQMLQMERVYQYLDSDRWFRWTAAGGRFLLGSSSYQTDWKWRKRTLEIEFDSYSATFNL